MKQSKHIKWAKVLLLVLGIQLLNYSIIMPSFASFIASTALNTPKNDNLLAHTLEDLFHLGSQTNNGQENGPSGTEELTGEKNFDLFEISYPKKESLKANNLSLQFVLYNNTAASLHQPELNTPPPKMA